MIPRRLGANPAAGRGKIIALPHAGSSLKELTKEFDSSEQTVRN